MIEVIKLIKGKPVLRFDPRATQYGVARGEAVFCICLRLIAFGCIVLAACGLQLAACGLQLYSALGFRL